MCAKKVNDSQVSSQETVWRRRKKIKEKKESSRRKQLWFVDILNSWLLLVRILNVKLLGMEQSLKIISYILG